MLRKLFSIALMSLIMIPAIMPIGNVKAAEVALSSYLLETNVIGGKIQQREFDPVTNQFTSWKTAKLPANIVPVSAVNIFKGGILPAQWGYSFILESVIAKDTSNNNNVLVTRRYNPELNLWSEWNIDATIKLSLKSKIATAKWSFSGGKIDGVVMAVMDANNDVKVRYSLDGEVWSSAYTAAHNAKGDLALTNSRYSTEGYGESQAIYLSFADNNNEIQTYVSFNVMQWYLHTENAYPEDVNSGVLVKTFNGYKIGAPETIASYLVQIKKNVDNRLYVRILDCFNPSDKCIWLDWRFTGITAVDDFSVTSIENNKFFITYKSMSGVGINAYFGVKATGWSSWALDTFAQEPDENTTSNQFVSAFIKSEGTNKIVLNRVFNGVNYSKVLEVNDNSFVDMNSGTWNVTGKINNLNYSSIVYKR